MDDRPFTPDELAILRRAQEVVARYLGTFTRPEKLDVIAIHCHPSDEAEMRARFDAPFVIDETVKPGTIGVVPHVYVKHIAVTVGFVNPPEGC